MVVALVDVQNQVLFELLTLAEESTIPRVDGLPTFQGLVVRQRELAELNAALGYAVSGQGRLVCRIGKRAVVCP